MTIETIRQLLNAQVLTGADNLSREELSACGSDMMSDVLAFVQDQAVLVTGLASLQAVRTASMLDMVCIVFVRGKTPDEATVKLAHEMDIVVLASRYSLFNACGLLYKNGLMGGNIAGPFTTPQEVL